MCFFLSFSSDICEGLIYLEQNRIVHRDIATSNVLIADDNTAKISDFGLAKLIDHMSKENGNGIINEKIKCRTKWTAPEALESKVTFRLTISIANDDSFRRNTRIKAMFGRMEFFFGNYFPMVEVLIHEL